MNSSPSAESTTLETPASGSTADLSALPWAGVEAALSRFSERLNPILVKEARQALKSKQFLITFALVLAFGWSWSLFGVAVLSPGIYYAPGGPFMLTGYFFILTAPVLVVVPFSAFRSLAAEREDGTYELLSITSLKSRQIVTGKLGSAVIQMLVYFCALAPCMAFTYLLRGVDIFSILFMLVTTVLTSILLAAAALLMATLARARHWQVAISVLLLIGLVIATIVWSIFVLSLIGSGDAGFFEDPAFWRINLAVICFYMAFLALFVVAAAGQLSFASDNRSTGVRIVLFVIHSLWLCWVTYFWVYSEANEVLAVLIVVACAYWFFVGAILTGENTELSPRVKRRLPQSFMGRVFLTWFNPGSGTGYVFACVNLLALVGIASCEAWIGAFQVSNLPTGFFLVTLLCFAYTVAYLGIGRLLLVAINRVLQIGVVLAMLVQCGVAIVGVAVPAFIQAWWQGYQQLDYTSWQVTNWIWTLERASTGSLWSHPEVPILIFSGAALIFFLNLAFAMHEVAQVRASTPDRVLEDEMPEFPLVATIRDPLAES